MRTCLPFTHLFLQQINSCVAGKPPRMVSTMHKIVGGSEEAADKPCQKISEEERKSHSNNFTSALTTTEGDGIQAGEEDVSTRLQYLATLQGPNDDTIVSKNTTSDHKAEITYALAKGDMSSSCTEPNVATIDRHKDEVFALAVAGDLLYSASQSKDIRVFRAPLFEEVDCFGVGNGVVQSLMAFGDKLYSAHQDNKIRVWRRVMKTSCADIGVCIKHKLVAVLPRLDHVVKSMLLAKNYVQVRRHKRKLWIEHADTISALTLGISSRNVTRGEAGDGSRRQHPLPTVLYSASWDKTVKVWSVRKFKCIESFYAHSDAINAMILIDGIVLATASADGSIKLWTKRSQYRSRRKKHSLINTLHGHKAAVNALAMSADAKILYSGDSDGVIIAWKKVSNRPKAGLSRQISSFSSSEKRLLQSVRSNIIASLSSGKFSEEDVLSMRGGIGAAAKGGTEGNITCEAHTRSLTRSEAEYCGSDGEDDGEYVVTKHYNAGRSSGSGRRPVMSSSSSSSARGRGASNVNFVMRKVIVGHTRAVLSVSTVGDNIVCSSSADKTIRVWIRRTARRRRPDERITAHDQPSGGRNSLTWDYECLSMLSGHGGPVKCIASVCPLTENYQLTSHARPQHAAAAAADAPLHGLHTYNNSKECNIVIFSAGLDSKVKVWVLPLQISPKRKEPRAQA